MINYKDHENEPICELIVCGRDEVFILGMRTSREGQMPEKVWSWHGETCAALPPDRRCLFGTTDDCKPVDGGESILITSSGNGVALVERTTGNILFHAVVPNAHSADILPLGRIAVASSVMGSGNRLLVFDINRPDAPFYSDKLPSAHGVVWDEKRGCVWALGFSELRKYRLKDWESAFPALVCSATYALPDEGGHDLLALPGTSALIITSHSCVTCFDRDTGTFTPWPPLANVAHVKGLAIHPENGQIAFVQAEGRDWWAERIHFLNPENLIHVSGEHFYKVRWNASM